MRASQSQAGFTPLRRSAEHGFTPLRRSAEHGFTLVELMVSLVIFAMLAAAGVALLSFSVRAQDGAKLREKQLAALRRADAIMTADFAQAVMRMPRDENGDIHQAFEGDPGGSGRPIVTLVRGGWENLDGAPRSSLQKVEYWWEGDRLLRRATRFVDGAEPMPPAVLLDGVSGIALRYRDREGRWRERWDPTRPTDLPRAVEIVAARRDGALRQLFLVGPPA